MGKIRRVIASLSMVAILASLVVTTTAFAFDDVPSNHWAYSYVESGKDEGLITNASNFRPNDSINRAEFAKFVVEKNGLEGTQKCSATFSDCEVNAWYDSYMGTAVQNGIINGDAGASTARPSGNANRAEVAAMLMRVMDGEDGDGSKYFADVPKSAWYNGAIGWAYCHGVMSGYADGTAGPAKLTTRAEALKMLYKASENDMIAACKGGTDPDTDPDVPSGDVSVKVSSDTPEGENLPSGATSVEVASWDFTASSAGEVQISSLEVHKTGVSTLPTSHQVYLYEGNNRLTSGRTVNTTTNIATFNNLNFTVPKGTTKTLTLRLDVGTATATGVIKFELESAESVSAGESDVSGSFPLVGEEFGITTTAAGTITIEKNGSVPNPSVGEDDVTIAKFKMTAATESANVKEFGLYIDGNISRSAVENLELYVSGEEEPIAEVAGLNSKDLAVFTGMDYEISKGDTRSFIVKADLNTGRADDTLKAYIDETTDVVAIGDTYGFGMTVTINGSSGYDGSSCTSSTGKCTYSTLEGGDITISSNGPVAQDIAIAGDDLSLMDFTITAVAPVTFESFPLFLTASESADTTEGLMNSTAANFTDIKIVNTDTGETLMGPIDADVLKTALGGSTAISEAADTVGYYVFGDEFDMSAGEELNLSITTDVENTATLNDMTVYATLDLSNSTGDPEITDVNNNTVTNSESLVPNADIVGKTMTIATPTLTLSLSSTPASKTWVKGARGVDFTGISFACGDASTCEVDDVTVKGYIDDSGTADNWSTTGTAADHSTTLNSYVGSIWLEDSEGNEIASAESVASNGTVEFTNLNWMIEAGETEVVFIMGDLSSNSFLNSDGENIAFGIASSTAVNWEDSDGQTRNQSGTPNSEGTSTTDPSTFVSTSAGGSLTVAVDSATPREDIKVAGTSDVEVSKFRFTTTDEPFIVKKLSINNRQSAVTTAALGNYDNNVGTLTISYTNSDGETEEKTGVLTNGTANFSGLDMMIDQDEDANLVVYADLNDIQGSSATAGEFVDLNLAFNDFEALAVASGETYHGDKLDASVSASSDLDFGTISFTDGDGSFELDGAQDVTLSLGTALTLTIDDAAGDNLNRLPVGTIICIDDDDSAACTTEDIYIVQSIAAGSTEDVYTVLPVDDAGDDNYDDNDPILYALPGTGYLTAANQMHVYEAKPSVTLASTSPSGSRSVNASDNPFVFTVTETGDQERVRVRAASDYTTCVAGTGTTLNNAALTTITVDGSSCSVAAVQTAGDSVLFANTADLSTYSYVSFWMRWNDLDANLATLVPGDVSVTTADANDGTEDQTTAVAAANIAGSPSYFVEDTWYLVRDVAMPTGTDSSDTFIGLVFNDTNTLAAGDNVYIDRFRAYNEKIELSMASEADFDRTIEQSSTAGPTVAYLKEGGTTLATGYVDVLAVDAGGDGAEDATDGSTAVVLFVPTSSEGDLEIAKGTSRTLTLQTSTQALLAEDAAAEDPLTVSMALGSSSSGSVTAGQFWWNETNSTVRWLGDVTNTTLTGNTIQY